MNVNEKNSKASWSAPAFKLEATAIDMVKRETHGVIYDKNKNKRGRVSPCKIPASIGKELVSPPGVWTEAFVST